MKCSKRTSDGIGCGAEAQSDSIYCFMHDDRPEIVQKRYEARSAGGVARRASQRGAPVHIDVSPPEAILESLRAVGQALADNECDRSIANALSYILATATQATKLVSHEKRIRKLEVKMGLREEDAE